MEEQVDGNNSTQPQNDGSSTITLQCRMYENQYPEVDDLVMVTVNRIAEMGAYVTLLEYNNIEGMVLLSELSRRRIRSVHRLVRVGKMEVVVVLRVDKDKGYIDLSKRRVSPEEQAAFEEKYSQSKTVQSIMRHVAEKNSLDLETLHQKITWPLFRKYGHAHKAFVAALADPQKIWSVVDGEEGEAQNDSSFLVSEQVKADLMASIVRRLTPQKVKIRSDIEVACFEHEGIDAIKRALMLTQNYSCQDVKMSVKLVAPPLYVIMTQCMDKEKGLSLMNQAVAAIEKEIKASKGQFCCKMAPKIVSETDEKDLDALMKRSEAENAEVGGDEDHSEL